MGRGVGRGVDGWSGLSQKGGMIRWRGWGKEGGGAFCI